VTRALARARNDWEVSIADFRDAEQKLNDAGRALEACEGALDDLAAAEWHTLTRRIYAARNMAASLHSCTSTTSTWWKNFSSMVPGLSAYHASGIAEILTPFTVGALNTSAAIMRVIAEQVTEFLTDLNQRRAA